MTRRDRHRPAVDRWGAAVVAALLVGTLAMVLFLAPSGGPGEATYQVYEPEGYVQQAEAWIRQGLLVYDCETRSLRVAEDLGPAEETFYRNSYLRDDVAAWNQGDRRPFLVEHEELRGGGCEGEVVGVNASFHKQRLPTYVAEAWEGSLFLRPTRGGTTLVSGRRSLEVLPAPWPLLPLSADAFEDAWLSDDRGGVRSQRLALKMPPGGRAFGTLKIVGEDAVLEVLDDRPALSVDSCPAPLGWRLRIGEGDVVRAHQEGRLDERFQVETGEEAAVVSFLTQVNGEPRRRSFPDRLSMAREVAYAVDAAVDAARGEGMEREDFDVHLTLDPFLDDRLDRVLADFARRYGSRLPRAAVTVMEPQSGRLLALASHPGTGALRRHGVEPDSTRWELLRRNHNFHQHPVGSAAKPFLAAAALAAHPALATLRVPCTPGGQPETLLGYDMGSYNLPGDCQGEGEEGLVDLEGFLEVSSNRYMLYLGLLSMAEWEDGRPVAVPGADPLPPEEGYVVGRRSLRGKPWLPMVRYDDDVPGDDQTLLQEVTQQSDLGDRFEALFDQGAVYRREGMVEGLDLDLWNPVLRAAYGGGEGETSVPAPAAGDAPAPRPVSAIAFSPVAPEEVNLRLNLAQQLRQDLYTVLLGNGNNRWSNVQLAEALSRLVTGRAVEARLVERVSVPAERIGGIGGAGVGAGAGGLPEDEVLWDLDDVLAAQEPPPLAGELPGSARERILAGMRRVVESPRGTAREVGLAVDRINRRAPEGVTYRALGKTGTPTLPWSVVRRGPVDPAPGAVVTYSGNRQVQSAVLVLVVERESREGVERLALTLFVDSQGGSEEAVKAATALLQPLVEAYWPRDWLEATG